MGYTQYELSERFPNVQNYKSDLVGSVDEGVVILTCLFISDKAYRGRGLGNRLLKAVIQELKGRGFKALETSARWGEAENPSGPVGFYLKKGFYIKDETNLEFPLMKLI